MANSTYLALKESEINKQYEIKIRAEETTCDQRIKQVELKRDDTLGISVVAGFVGFICWFAIHNFIVGLIIGIIVYCVCGVLKKHSIDAEINDIKNRCSANIRNLKEDENQKITAIRAEYDEKTSQCMMGYLRTNKTTELENWIAKRFFAQINGADRRSHIKDITAKYTYSIQRDKVVGDDGIFDFEIQRYQRLENIYEQIGLARAICKKIQRTTENTYTIDVSGTKPSISRSSDDYTITLTYYAPNGKYQFARSWK